MTDQVQVRLLEEITRRVVYKAFGLEDPFLVVLGVSNRHVHLSEEDFKTLFGRTDMTPLKYVRQHGEFAAEETVAVHGPKGSFAKVRVMGPPRKQSQVELSKTDCFQLGIDAPTCESGFLDAAAPVDLEGPNGRIHFDHAAMVAGRHLHLGPDDARALGVQDNDRVSVQFGGVRGGTLDNFKCRVKDSFIAECHLDTDEANGLGVRTGDMVRVVKD